MIDACVHHRWASDADVYPYLEPGWREYVGEPNSLPLGLGARRLVPVARYPNPVGEMLPGAEAGSTVEGLRTALFADERVERALLLFDRSTMFAPTHPNPYFAAAVVRAANEWNRERFLEEDERLYGAVLVPDQIPTDGAAEIRRAGAHPKIAAALLAAPSIGRLLGHPLYDPIYAAASELGLPVVIHRGLDALPDTPTSVAGGAPYTFAEYATVAPLALMTNVISLITNGVFARHPELRVYVVGGGIVWCEGMLLRVDQLWKALRRDIPWVRESPTEYFSRHVRVSTYGLERGAGEMLERAIASSPHLRELLVYGSGTPSWDTATADEIEPLFPADWHDDVFGGNAGKWFFAA